MCRNVGRSFSDSHADVRKANLLRAHGYAVDVFYRDAVLGNTSLGGRAQSVTRNSSPPRGEGNAVAVRVLGRGRVRVPDERPGGVDCAFDAGGVVGDREAIHGELQKYRFVVRS